MDTKAHNKMAHYEKKLMLSFGLIVFILILLLSGLSILFYHDSLLKERDKLSSTITNLLKLSIQKINFSENESSNLLIEEMQIVNPEISYIMILDKNGKILVHSKPELNAKRLSSDKISTAIKSLNLNQKITQELFLNNNHIREFNIPIKLKNIPELHVLRVGISNDIFIKKLNDSLYFVCFLAIGITALAMIYIHFLSAKLSAPVKNMAQKFQGILDFTPMMIIIKDRDGNISDISKNCYDIIPREQKQNSSIYLASIISKDQMVKFKKNEKALFDGDKLIATREYSVHFSDADRNIILTTFPVIQNLKGEVTHLCHISVDITERIQFREQFMQAQKMESLGHLAGGISHDFNNIISVIIGYASLLLTNENLSEETKADIGNIQEASLRATALVKKLMAFSRRDSLKPTKTDINLLIKETETLFFRLIPGNIHLKMNLISYPLFVLIDVAYFEQVLLNLINNSVDAIGKEDGNIIIATKVKEFSKKTRPSHDMAIGKYVELSIRDTGCGMDKSILGKIFEPFFTTKSLEKGNGLGLSMVFGLVKQLKGDVLVKSEPDNGATFKIYLPLEPESDIESEDKQKIKEEQHVKEKHGNKTILVAEDEAFVRQLIKRTLEKYQYKIIVAENGQQAIDMALTNKIDLLLTDIIMPFKNGTEVYAEIHESKPDLPCIFMSGYTADLLKDPPGAEEVNFLQKPLNLDKLLTMVQKVLQKINNKNT